MSAYLLNAYVNPPLATINESKLCVYFLFSLCACSAANIMTMLRLLLLTLLLTVKADKSDHEASGGEYDTDDEEQEDGQERITTFENSLLAAEVKNVPDDAETEDGHTMVIIIAAVCVVALAIVTVIAVVLFKLHLQRREQGVYSVPVEQGQKGV
ncbi:uncharacterized protein si:dkey-262k9.2 isoform X2 [Clarias gariepinus]|uniref:uncharacterized protein si:dkey-262k9.2 isoform X2 n=1 Tax=Clarias gariepinus TaxID=13013 RepID=UPI00234D0DA9|nr:uncharacterized protein si:dkey-262k9.2 isoform X2 [Clarias gariepinus]